MNDLRSPLEDRPYRIGTARSDERVIATSEYYRTRLGTLRESRWFPLACVLTAVVAFCGIVSYAYNQGSQSGENATTPIVTADAGVIKEKPENPGGMEVPFQDAVVFDQLQKTSDNTTPGETVENLLAPPEQPLAEATTAAPAPVAAEQVSTEMPVAAASEQTSAPVTAPIQTADAAPAPAAVTAPVAQAAPVEQPAAATTKQEPAPVAAPVAVPTETAAAAPIAAPAPVVATPAVTAPTPVVKTETAEVKKIAATAPAAASATAKIEAGSYRIQLGAFRDEAAARAAWSKFQKEFHAQLSSVAPAFPRADLGAKGVFYRVQGTNLSKASADQLCRTLNTSRAGSCMVVK